ncbi:MAG: hypothetical protein KF819_06870 [Labilithrix sp.]|nr:hypothetical protein [Labilithrix sp.]
MVGDAPELDDAAVSAPLVRVDPNALTTTGGHIAAVFDLRRASVTALAAMRATPALSGLPLLLVAEGEVPDSVVTLLRADDAVALSDRSLRRRLAVVVELGRARAALVERTRLCRAVLDGVEVGVVTTNARGAVTFINRAAAALLEAAPDLSGVPVTQLLALSHAPEALLGPEVRRSIAYRLHTAEGLDLDLELVASRAESASTDRSGFFFVFRDVREEKRREADRARFERLAAMGTMVAGFAHEVRNPVAALRSLAEDLRDEGVSAPHVGLILQMVERIERLVRTSLQFGRPAAPKRAPRRPAHIASLALAEIRPRLRGHDGDIVLETEVELPEVNVDDRQVAQALVILLNNALDATGSPSRVTLRIRSVHLPSPSVRFEVIDDGPGVSRENLRRIFDPFFTTKPSGTGLGLSIAQQIVSENGARLEVTSALGGMTCFCIVVPIDGATLVASHSLPFVT